MKYKTLLEEEICPELFAILSGGRWSQNAGAELTESGR